MKDDLPSGKGKKHWLMERNPITDLLIVACAAFLTGAVGSFLVELNAPHDFSISIEPVSVLENGSRLFYILGDIYVNNSRWMKKYDHSVCLYSDQSTLPKGVEVELEPIAGHVPFISKLSILLDGNKSTLRGNYKLRIKAIGGDETERSCTFIFYIKNDQLNTNETQSSPIKNDIQKDYKSEINAQNYAKSFGI